MSYTVGQSVIVQHQELNIFCIGSVISFSDITDTYVIRIKMRDISRNYIFAAKYIKQYENPTSEISELTKL